MNILVTGSAGMIGGYVVKGLIEKGYSVIGVDRVLPKTESSPSMERPKVERFRLVITRRSGKAERRVKR